MTGNSASWRLNKWLAATSILSRRAADDAVLAGRVSVNGVLAEHPSLQIHESDQVCLDGQVVTLQKIPRLWAFHKPLGFVVSEKIQGDKPCIYDILPKILPQGRPVYVGRLDINSSGLLLLTNSPSLKRFLELPEHKITRSYEARIYGNLSPKVIAALQRPVLIEGISHQFSSFQIIRQGATNAHVIIGLQEGKNREIRKIMEHFGLQVNRLIRKSYGPIKLLDLPLGEVREIPQQLVMKILGQEARPKKGWAKAKPDRFKKPKKASI